MKKRMLIVIAIFLVFVLMIGIMYAIDRDRMKNNKPVIFSTWGYRYTPPINLNEEQISKAINSYIVNRNESSSKKYQDEKWFSASRIYKIEEKEDATTIVYAWVLEESYYKKDNEIMKDSGSSIPYQFTLKKNEQGYEVITYQTPRDGTYYAEDMKEIFPKDVLDNLNNVYSDNTIEELSLSIEGQVSQYFKEDTDYYSFVGTVLEETTTYMIVEPNEDEEERKSADKIKINYGTDHIDYLYGIGRKVLIRYTGYIMETYPAQINTNNIEIEGYSDFEITVEKSKNIEKKKILNNKELNADGTDYNLYYYGLDKVNVKVDGKVLSLEEALKSGKVTLNGIISKANSDLDKKIIKGDVYKDGGSMIYQCDTYTIIKCHTLDGDRDVYIGVPTMQMNNVV